jgi:hypothetical protein
MRGYAGTKAQVVMVMMGGGRREYGKIHVVKTVCETGMWMVLIHSRTWFVRASHSVILCANGERGGLECIHVYFFV